MQKAKINKQNVNIIVQRLSDIVNVDIKKMHCISCGRFLGFQAIVDGAVIVYCNKCKNFTVLFGESELELEE